MSSTSRPNPMAEPRKFMFDRSFDIEVAPKKVEAAVEAAVEAEPEVVIPTFSEEEMKAARDEAFAAGKEEGRMEVTASTEREVLVTLTRIADEIGGISGAQDRANASLVESAIAVAVAIARKVFPAWNEKYGLAEIERMVTKAMERLVEEPRVVIYVNAKLLEPLKERLGPLAAKAGFKGEMTVEGIDDLIVGDCRVEWMGGGAKRDMDELWQEIDAIVEHNLSGDTAGADPDADKPLESTPGSEATTPTPAAAILDAKLDAKIADAAPAAPAPAPAPESTGAPAPGSPDKAPAAVDAPGSEDTATDRGDT